MNRDTKVESLSKCGTRRVGKTKNTLISRYVGRSVGRLVSPLFTFAAFLVADTQLYKWICPSVGPSVRNHESKSWKRSVLDTWVNVGVGVGLDGGWMPLPTRPQRYRDPVSLVRLFELTAPAKMPNFIVPSISFFLSSPSRHVGPLIHRAVASFVFPDQTFTYVCILASLSDLPFLKSVTKFSLL